MCKTKCAECQRELPAGEVAWCRLDGTLICSSCFYAREKEERRG